jgi:pimeloyl-ACP methyl ester carboxylesterase
MPTEGAVATVLLFSGGSGGIGYRDGQPNSGNFLIRSRDTFRAEQFNVALIGNPSDKRQLDDAWRTSGAHLVDTSNIIESIRKDSPLPVWIIGTSRGTISAAALAIGLQQQIAGAVLTASITSYQLPAAVPRQAIHGITVPVLVYHHKDDACAITVPWETDWIMRGLTRAPVKRQMLVSGGSSPRGDPCEAFHWHGFVGMEERAVRDIAAWIRHPEP